MTFAPSSRRRRLLVARQHRAGHRDADAAADVAHQVEQARRVAHLLARDRIHRDRRQRHEEQRHAGALDELRPEDVPVARLQVQLRQPEQRHAADDQSDRQQLPRRRTCPVMQPGDRHHEERSDAARRHRDAGLQRRIAEQRLQHDRQQHQAAVQHEADAPSSGTRRRRSCAP